jgi:transcriptional regulator with XRE-family HTH domain
MLTENNYQDLIFKFFKDAMKERRITQKKLSELIGVDESTLIRNFQKKSEMSMLTFLKICGALELRPYLVPVELDDSEVQRIFFN